MVGWLDDAKYFCRLAALTLRRMVVKLEGAPRNIEKRSMNCYNLRNSTKCYMIVRRREQLCMALQAMQSAIVERRSARMAAGLTQGCPLGGLMLEAADPHLVIETFPVG